MNKTKENKKVLIIITILLFLLMGSIVYYNYIRTHNSIEEIENRVSLKDDFYESINYDIFKKVNDKESWSKMSDVEEIVEKRTDEITDEILSDSNYKNEEMDIIIELFKDYEGGNKRGLSELQTYFDMIDNAKTINDFNDVLLTLTRDTGENILINYAYEADISNPSKNVIVIEPIKLFGYEFEHFTDSKYDKYITYIRKIIKIYCDALGYTSEESADLINKLEDFAKNIQSKSLYSYEVEDTVELYNNKYTLSEIDKSIKKIPIKRLLTELKIDKEDYYVVLDMGHYKALDEFYSNENLPLLKEYAKLVVLNSFFRFTTQDNARILFDLENEMINLPYSFEEQQEMILYGIKQSFIKDEIEKRYEAKYFTEEDKKVIEDLVNDVKYYYKEVIKQCEWLSESAKESAIKKLDNMKVNIGYQIINEIKENSYMPLSKAEGGTLITYFIGNHRYDFDNYYKKFKKEAILDGLSTLEVNAFYHPQNNSINFLAGYKEMYGDETNYYRLLGNLGTTIGHEISHAFDIIGSKFDENGISKDWWTEEDKINYNNLTKKIENYYSMYEYGGYKVDGKKTLGENIADLAAMKVIICIAESKGATNEDYKKLFESYANSYASKMSEDKIEYQLLMDEHAPDKIRVNAVLSSMDKFYEIYNIEKDDKMFIPSDERVGLW